MPDRVAGQIAVNHREDAAPVARPAGLVADRRYDLGVRPLGQVGAGDPDLGVEGAVGGLDAAKMLGVTVAFAQAFPDVFRRDAEIRLTSR